MQNGESNLRVSFYMDHISRKSTLYRMPDLSLKTNAT